MRQGCINYQNNNHEDGCPILPGPFPIIIGPTSPSCGATGSQGIEDATGPTGPAPTLEIGTVTTGEPGTTASVTITPINN